jgi:hypothetical protein
VKAQVSDLGLRLAGGGRHRRRLPARDRVRNRTERSRRRPGDPHAVWDLDEAGWAETFTHRDASLAPDGQHLVQAQLGLDRVRISTLR